MKLEVGSKHRIYDGNGGVMEAMIKGKTKVPARILYVARKKPNVGRFTKSPVELTIPAFKKMLVSKDD